MAELRSWSDLETLDFINNAKQMQQITESDSRKSRHVDVFQSLGNMVVQIDSRN